MSFRLTKHDRDLTRLLRRVAASELGAALDPGATVHDARKRVKKVRALLRLVRAGFPEGQAIGRALGDAAAHLSALRDAQVMLATHDRLAPDAADGTLRAHLAARLAAAQDDPAQQARLDAFRAVLADVRDGAGGWKVTGGDAKVLRAGLARTRRRAQHAMAAAQDDRDGEPMHDWRKRVKDLWYQSRLLSPVWPAILQPMAETAGDLGEMLGDHHDLIVFAALLDSLPETPDLAASAADLRTRGARARAAIEAQAFPMGRILLSGDPQAVARLWYDWWKLWRDQRA